MTAWTYDMDMLPDERVEVLVVAQNRETENATVTLAWLDWVADRSNDTKTLKWCFTHNGEPLWAHLSPYGWARYETPRLPAEVDF